MDWDLHVLLGDIFGEPDIVIYMVLGAPGRSPTLLITSKGTEVCGHWPRRSFWRGGAFTTPPEDWSSDPSYSQHPNSSSKG